MGETRAVERTCPYLASGNLGRGRYADERSQSDHANLEIEFSVFVLLDVIVRL